MKRSVLKRSIILPLQLAAVVVFAVVGFMLLFVHGTDQPTAAAVSDARARCEAKGDWWDEQDHVCAIPTPISTITGHPASGR
jgi:hypothetical protein